MLTADYLPHIKLLLGALRINNERLSSKSKIAVDARLLRMLLQQVVAKLPFSAEFYRRAYPDLAAAHDAGDVPDLHQHFIETGFFEGRLGAAPKVDEAFYTSLYPDVATAVRRGDVPSATEHYLGAGIAEGRIPSAVMRPTIELWNSILGHDMRVAP